MTYIIYGHDAWGRAELGSFADLDQARRVFEELRNDRWCNADGGMRAVSLVEAGANGPATIAHHSF